MVDIQTVSIVIASASVVAGVIYYSLMIRHQSLQTQHQNKIRETELLIKIHPWLNVSSSELQRAYSRILSLEFTDADDFVKRYGSMFLIKPEQEAFLSATNYFDALGVLVKRGLVDADLVYEVWTGDIVRFWEKVKPIVEAIRKEVGYPFLVNAEYLYNEMKKREQRGVKNG
jgi:predicted DNA-binding transcriptional regulator